MPRDYSPLRETIFDLYIEKERLPWYYRTLALISSWLALGGYILFALVFTSQEDNMMTSRSALTGLASTCLALGYIMVSLTAWMSKSLLFCFDSILLPLMTASFMGVFVIVMNHALHKRFPIPNRAFIYAPLVIACVTTVTTFVLSALLYRKLRRVKASDNRIRGSTTRASYSDQYSSMTELMTMQEPEDEAQRRQLRRLLQKRNLKQAGSPGSGSTYRIDLPPSLGGDNRGQYLAVAPGEVRGRSDSQPESIRKGILGHILPARARSATGESFVDPRERRRSEIERGVRSMQSTPRLLSDAWSSSPALQPSPYIQYDQPASHHLTQYA